MICIFILFGVFFSVVVFGTNEVQSNWFQPIYLTNWTRTMLNYIQWAYSSIYACVFFFFFFVESNYIKESGEFLVFYCSILNWDNKIETWAMDTRHTSRFFLPFAYKYTKHANTITFTQEKKRKKQTWMSCSGKKIARLLN